MWLTQLENLKLDRLNKPSFDRIDIKKAVNKILEIPRNSNKLLFMRKILNLLCIQQIIFLKTRNSEETFQSSDFQFGPISKG